MLQVVKTQEIKGKKIHNLAVKRYSSHFFSKCEEQNVEAFFTFGKCIKYVSFEYITLSKSCHENSFIYSVSLSELSTSESSEGFGILLEHPASEASGAPLFFTVCVNFNTDCICVTFVNLEDFPLHRSKCAGKERKKESLYHCLP